MKQIPSFIPADICISKFSAAAIGTRVVSPEAFYQFLIEAVEKHDESQDRTPGQHYVVLPAEALETVSSGVGPRTQDPDDFVKRCYRGVVSLFLKREKAAKAESLAVVVYTRDAYLADPDVSSDSEETTRILESNATHVIVTILASAGPRAPRGPYRFVHCLAGGNKDADTWTLSEIREMAKDIIEYHDKWCTVAD